MANRPHHRRRRGRTTPKGTRRTGSSRRGSSPDHFDDPIARDLALELAAPSPLPLLMAASAMVEAATPRDVDQFSATPIGRVSPSSFVELAGVDSDAARSFMLAVATVTPDPILAEQLKQIIGPERSAGMPPWIDEMDQVSAQRAFAQRHEQADGENIVVTWRWSNGHEGTIVGYIDFHSGSALTDGFCIDGGPEPILQSALDPDLAIETTELEPADARARLEAAIAHGDHFVPPYETDTWPMVRPMLEWALRSFPTGGDPAVEPVEWSPADIEALVDAFLESTYAPSGPRSVSQPLAELIIEFATGYGSCLPWAWSPQRVEIFLVDWFPRKVFGLSDAQVAALPGVLGDMVRFAQTRSGVSDDTVDATIGAVNYFEPHYLTAMNGDGASAPSSDELDLDLAVQTLLASISAEAGGMSELATLDDEPLPVRPFDWSAVSGELEAPTAATLEVMDRWASEYFDDEVVTMARAVLAAVVSHDQAVFRRSPNPDSLAAAILGHVLDRTTRDLGRRTQASFDWSVTTYAALARVTGVSASSIGARSKTIAKLIDGADIDWTTLLHSAQRRQMIDTREMINTWRENNRD